MRAVVQPVRRAQVTVKPHSVGSIRRVLLVLLGVANSDTETDAHDLASQVVGLRAFEDAGGKMNRAAREVEGSVMVVSQFTLYGDVQRENGHPSMPPLLPKKRAPFTNILSSAPAPRAYVANRQVSGDDASGSGERRPVTILLDSSKAF